jgi:hypothetical protein
MEIAGLVLILVFLAGLTAGISYLILFVYANRVIRNNDPDPQTLLGVVSPKKED